MPESPQSFKQHLKYVFPLVLTAMRFALLEAKVALAKLLLKAELELAPGHEDLVVTSEANLTRPKDGVKLVLKPLREE